MSSMQGWAQTVNNLMSRFEDTMEVLGIPDHQVRDGEDPRGAEPKRDEHNLIVPPAHNDTHEADASERSASLGHTSSMLIAICMRDLPALGYLMLASAEPCGF